MTEPVDIVTQALQGRAIVDERDVAAQVLEALLAAGTVEYGVRSHRGTIRSAASHADAARYRRRLGGTVVQRRVFHLTEEWTTT